MALSSSRRCSLLVLQLRAAPAVWSSRDGDVRRCLYDGCRAYRGIRSGLPRRVTDEASMGEPSALYEPCRCDMAVSKLPAAQRGGVSVSELGDSAVERAEVENKVRKAPGSQNCVETRDVPGPRCRRRCEAIDDSGMAQGERRDGDVARDGLADRPRDARGVRIPGSRGRRAGASWVSIA